MDSTVIRLDASHRAAAVATLCAAFADDPAICFMFPDAAVRARRLPGLMGWSFDDHLAHGLVLGTPGAETVTLWRPPGTVHRHDPLTPPAIARFLGIFGTAILRAERVDRYIGKHIPAGEDLFYLRMAAVRPDRQGQGLGGLTIRAGLENPARQGARPVLETATESNLGLYARLGYRIVDEWTVGRSGPRFWTMSF